jgi:hypothetical protein
LKVAYVTQKRGVYYAVIYEGRNPVTGRERRRWHRCEHHADAQRLARELGAQRERRNRAGSSMTLADYLLGRWLTAKEATLAPSTNARHCSAVNHYLLPDIGDTPLRRLRDEHFRSLYRSIAGSSSREAITGDRWQRRRSTTSTNLSVPRCATRSMTGPTGESRRARACAGPPAPSIGSSTRPVLDRGGARRVPRRDHTESSRDAVPPRRGDRHAPR